MQSGINVKIFSNFWEPRLKGGGWMGPLGILNTARSSLPTPTNFTGCSRSTKKELLYYRSFCLKPIVGNTSSISHSCAKQLTHLAGYSPVERTLFFKQESGDIAMGLPVFRPLYNG